MPLFISGFGRQGSLSGKPRFALAADLSARRQSLRAIQSPLVPFLGPIRYTLKPQYPKDLAKRLFVERFAAKRALKPITHFRQVLGMSVGEGDGIGNGLDENCHSGVIT
jgi:hypothetical protein